MLEHTMHGHEQELDFRTEESETLIRVRQNWTSATSHWNEHNVIATKQQVHWPKMSHTVTLHYLVKSDTLSTRSFQWPSVASVGTNYIKIEHKCEGI